METVLYLLLLYKFPILTLFITLLFFIKRKIAIDYIKSQPPIRPRNGDILIFFGDHKVSPFYEVMLTLPTMYPFRHYGIMIDDNYFVESRRTDVFRWDNFTNQPKSGVRLGKLKHIEKDWNQGPIGVIQTDLIFPEESHERVMKTDYWSSGGCLGTVNQCIRIINPDHKYCYLPEEFMNQYGKKIGPIII